MICDKNEGDYVRVWGNPRLAEVKRSAGRETWRRIVGFLRGGPSTLVEVARAVDRSPQAVRAHLDRHPEAVQVAHEGARVRVYLRRGVRVPPSIALPVDTLWFRVRAALTRPSTVAELSVATGARPDALRRALHRHRDELTLCGWSGRSVLWGLK